MCCCTDVWLCAMARPEVAHKSAASQTGAVVDISTSRSDSGRGIFGSFVPLGSVSPDQARLQKAYRDDHLHLDRKVRMKSLHLTDACVE